MVRVSSERYTVQDPISRYAGEIGWTYLTPNESLRLRRGDSSPILWDIFIDQAQRLNPERIDHLEAEEIAKRLLRVPVTVEGNLEAWEYLKGLKTVFVRAESRERDLRLIDFGNVERNTFHVTDEFRFTNGLYTIRADVVFSINGIPVILIETKSASKLEGIAEALDQVRRYHREAPELLSLTQLYGLTHLIQFYYGATWSLSHKTLLNWREEAVGADFERLIKSFFAPDRVLRILTDFTMFVRREDELQKVVLRPHQMRAVERALVRARDPQRRRGLVWHTQGSGKTYTMMTIAKMLIEDPLFQNPTVLMLVDRTELEGQLFGNLKAAGMEQYPIAQSKRHLQELLASDYQGLIVAMIHKFDEIPANINTRSNIFVLVDEAHRSTGGDLGNYLLAALPNATFFGFTGTPIDKTAYGRGTFKVFGTDDPETGYLDKYSIAESIAEGATVPLYYTLAPNELRADRETLNREFLDLSEAEGVSDIEDLNHILDRAVNLRNMLKGPERVQRIAQYVAKDFLERVEPMGYKAFLVGVDREACVYYKEALDKYLPPEYSAVVISEAHNDPEHLRRHHLTDEQEKKIRKDFVDEANKPKLLIVTEKLLTGYDAPVLYCMYLDKPMRDHVLLQAIARVNRPYEDENGKHKPGGFVLDFIGIFENLAKALAFDSKDVESVIEGLDVLRVRFASMMAIARRNYLPMVSGRASDKAAEAVLQHFLDEEVRHQFQKFYLELEDLYEIISPDEFMRDYLTDYSRLADLHALLRAAYSDSGFIDRDLARKTARLLREHSSPGVIHDALAVYEINEETLDKIAENQEPDTVKVFNLLKSIEKAVIESVKEQPYLMPIGQRAEEIAEAFRERQISTEQALEQFQSLIEAMNEAKREQTEHDFSPEAFAIYWILMQSGVAQAKPIAEAMSETLIKYAHWRTSEQQARAIRQELYRHLAEDGVADVPEVADQVMTMLQRNGR